MSINLDIGAIQTSGRDIGALQSAGTPAAITGTGASSFHFASSASAVVNETGLLAAKFHFASASTGTVNEAGLSASSFHFASAATGTFSTQGSGAGAFYFKSAASGRVNALGTATDGFHFAVSATGRINPRGTSAARFHFAVSGAGAVPGSGNSNAHFHFGTAALGYFIPPTPPKPPNTSGNFLVVINGVPQPCLEGTPSMDWKFQQRATAEFTIPAYWWNGPAGSITASSLNAGGSGYHAGDSIAIVQGTDVAQGSAYLVVDTVSGGGAVLTYHITAEGFGYLVQSGALTVGGSGVGLLINIDAVSPVGIRLGPVDTMTVFLAGHGYNVDDEVVVSLMGAGSPCHILVDSIDGSGGIVTFHVKIPGMGYAVAQIYTSSPLTGGGVGAAFTITGILNYRPQIGQPVRLIDTIPGTGPLAGPYTIFGGTIDDIVESSMDETEGNPIGSSLPIARTMDCKCVSFEQRLDKRFMPGSSSTNFGSGEADVFVDVPVAGQSTLTYVNGEPAFTDALIGRYVTLHDLSGHRVSILVLDHPTSGSLTLSCNPQTLTPDGLFDSIAFWSFPSPGTKFRSWAGTGIATAQGLQFLTGDPFDPDLIGKYLNFPGGSYAFVDGAGGFQCHFSSPIIGVPGTGGGAVLSGYFVNPGTGYEVGDVLSLPDIGVGCTIEVDSLQVNRHTADGVISAFQILTPGVTYLANRTYATTGGTGTGATFYVTSIQGAVISWTRTWYAGAVFSQLCAGLAAEEGITTGSITLGPPVAGTLVYDNMRLTDALDDISQRVDYMWYVDPAPDPPLINFVPKNALTPLYSITDYGLISQTSPSITGIYRNIQTETTRIDVRNSEWLKIGIVPYFENPGITNDTTPCVQVSYPIASIVNINGSDTNIGIWGVDTGKNWYYIPGFSVVLRDPSNTTPINAINYAPAFQDTVSTPNATAAAARAVIEGGSGVYEHQTDLTQTVSDAAVGVAGGSLSRGIGWAASQNYGNVLVAANQQNVVKVTFQCDTPGFFPGQYMPIQNTARDVDGFFLVDEIQFNQIRRFDAGGNDYFSGVYTITCLSNELQNWLALFVALTKGGAGANVQIAGGGGAGITNNAPYCFVFGVGSDGKPANLIVNSLTNALIVTEPGSLVAWKCNVTDASAGADVIFDVLHNGASIFATRPTQPAGVTAVQSGATLSGGAVAVAIGDTLQGTITQIGSSAPGKGATLELIWV